MQVCVDDYVSKHFTIYHTYRKSLLRVGRRTKAEVFPALIYKPELSHYTGNGSDVRSGIRDVDGNYATNKQVPVNLIMSKAGH